MARKTTTPKTFEELTPDQAQVIDLLAHGKAAPSVAPAELARPVFVAALNKRRADLWAAAQDRLRALVPQALDILAQDLESEDPKQRQAAAVHVLRCAGLYGADLTPKGPVTPGRVEAEHKREALFDSVF